MREIPQIIKYTDAYLRITAEHPNASLRERAVAAEQAVSSQAWVDAITYGRKGT